MELPPSAPGAGADTGRNPPALPSRQPSGSHLKKVLSAGQGPSTPPSPVKGAFVCERVFNEKTNAPQVGRAWQAGSCQPLGPEEGTVSSCGQKTRQPHFLSSSEREKRRKEERKGEKEKARMDRQTQFLTPMRSSFTVGHYD